MRKNYIFRWCWGFVYRIFSCKCVITHACGGWSFILLLHITENWLEIDHQISTVDLSATQNVQFEKKENTCQDNILEYLYTIEVSLFHYFLILQYTIHIIAIVRRNIFKTLFCVIFGTFTLNSVGILLLAYFRYIIVFAVGGTWRNVAA